MKRIVWTFGLISGGILAATMAVSVPLWKNGVLGHSEIFGYSTMLLALLLVFFGVRSYRENVGGGTITFGKGFQVGLLVSLIACACYVISWEVISHNFFPDFADKYAAQMLEKMRADGAAPAAIDAAAKEMAHFKELYANPFFNVGMTFMEIFPVALIVTLVSAGILRRKTPRVAA